MSHPETPTEFTKGAHVSEVATKDKPFVIAIGGDGGDFAVIRRKPNGQKEPMVFADTTMGRLAADLMIGHVRNNVDGVWLCDIREMV